MVFSALEQLEALMESLCILIGHCHGMSGHTLKTDRFKRVALDHGSHTRRQTDDVQSVCMRVGSESKWLACRSTCYLT